MENIETTSCHSCGIQYGLPLAFIAARRSDHKSFSCPNGHLQYFRQQTKTERLTEQVALLTMELEDTKRLLQAEKDRADKNFNLAHALGKVS